MKHDQITQIIREGFFLYKGTQTIKVTLEDLQINKEFIGDSKYESISNSNVLMDYNIDDNLEAEGVCNAISSQISFLRKEAKLNSSDKINVHFCFVDENDKVCQYLKQNVEYLKKLVKDTGIFFDLPSNDSQILLAESPERKAQKEKEKLEKKEKEKSEREEKEKKKKEKEKTR